MASGSMIKRVLGGLAGLIAAWGMPLTALAETAGQVVGEVTTLIGEANLQGGAGDSRAMARGQHVRAGDRIETAAGGHVHLRFIDGGLVSVRPLSRLRIDAYQAGDRKTLAAIKFTLEEGVVRSVTGQWGEANRDRFRLNTPVAAIGIKGTDFVIKTDQASAYATVVSGAIVMSPLDGDCANTLGPCAGANAATLEAEMRGKMLRFVRAQGGAPQIVPAVDLLARQGGSAVREHPVALPAEALDTEGPGKARFTENVVATAEPLAEAANAGLPLLWLHNQAGWNVPPGSISTRYDQAVAAGRRAVVGNLFVNLYRDETVLTRFQPEVAAASFQLAGASAAFARTGRPATDVVDVRGGRLDVDFANARFATALDLHGARIGDTRFEAAGVVTDRGILLSQGNGHHLAGAFSMDGRQAGYSFEQTVVGGRVSGLTLWGR